MKSTYKLLGLQWDHGPLPSVSPYYELIRKIPNYTVERNLFDLSSYERQVFITELLSVENIELIKQLVDSVSECDSVYINIDYTPAFKNKDIISFYYLRILQIYAYFCNSLPNARVLLMCDDETRVSIQEFWKEKSS